MNRLTGWSLALVAGLCGTAAAQDTTTPLAGKGEAVTITGCVLAGTHHDSVVLTDVKELTGGASAQKVWLGPEGISAPPGQEDVIYWLNHESVKKVRAEVGHRVQISGRVTDVSTGSVKFKKDPGAPGADNKVEVSARGKEAKANTNKDVGTMATGVATEEKHELPVHRIHVDTVKMLSATCS